MFTLVFYTLTCLFKIQILLWKVVDTVSYLEWFYYIINTKANKFYHINLSSSWNSYCKRKTAFIEHPKHTNLKTQQTLITITTNFKDRELSHTWVNGCHHRSTSMVSTNFQQSSGIQKESKIILMIYHHHHHHSQWNTNCCSDTLYLLTPVILTRILKGLFQRWWSRGIERLRSLPRQPVHHPAPPK